MVVPCYVQLHTKYSTPYVIDTWFHLSGKIKCMQDSVEVQATD